MQIVRRLHADDRVALQCERYTIRWRTKGRQESERGVAAIDYWARDEIAVGETGVGMCFGLLVDHYTERGSHVLSIIILDVDRGVDARGIRAGSEHEILIFEHWKLLESSYAKLLRGMSKL